jgi:ADP-ribose pyrophosphatase YjhB (NUDIX family)
VLRVGASGVLQTLVWQRRDAPQAGRFALPGGFLAPGESLEASARRHLRDKVGVPDVGHLEQLETRSEPERDPRGWVVTTAFLALVAPETEAGDAPDTAWWDAAAPPPLAFDHDALLALAVERLRRKLSYSNIAFALAPPTFSISELRTIYAGALGYEVSATNLQRVLLRGELLERTGERRAPGAGGGRPAELFRFRDCQLTISRPLAAFRPRGEPAPAARRAS